jgi:shikimate kinase
MDVVLVGLPGSGKSVVGKRLAHRHNAIFIDLDERIERVDGRPIPTIFAEDGEGAFRALERRAVEDLGPPDPSPFVARVIASGGGAIVDPRNRWSLYRRRLSVWLDSRPEVLAQRLRRSPHVRPLITGRDPIGTIRDLAARRERFYAAADVRIGGVAEVSSVVEAVEANLAARRDGRATGTRLLSARPRRRSGGSTWAIRSRPPPSARSLSDSRRVARSSSRSPVHGPRPARTSWARSRQPVERSRR